MLDRHAIGAVSDPVRRTWSRDDAMLYALALGAGTSQLDLVTENSEGVVQRLLPTFAALLGGGSKSLRDQLGHWPAHATVHGSQTVSLPGPLPVEGDVEVVSTVAAITDKGSGAVLDIDAVARDRASGAVVFTSRTSLFLRGQGWGEPQSGGDPDPVPDRHPDVVVVAETTENQALLYRLCGDRNPLHSDPTFAQRAGFDRPILHGLCTWGVAARVLLSALEERGVSAPLERLASFGGRFRAPVLPGDILVIRAWQLDSESWAHTTSVGDKTVIDRGTLSFRQEAS